MPTALKNKPSGIGGTARKEIAPPVKSSPKSKAVAQSAGGVRVQKHGGDQRVGVQAFANGGGVGKSGKGIRPQRG